MKFILGGYLYESISIDKEVFVIVSGIIAEIIATKISKLIPGVGLGAAAVIAAAMKIYKKYSNPNKDLSEKIAKDVMKKLKEKFDESFMGVDEFGEVFSDELNEKIGGYKAKLYSITKVLENPKDKEKEIDKIKNEIEEVDSYLKRVDSLIEKDIKEGK